MTPRGSTENRRRYRVEEILGHGGFGRVYRAVLEGPAGFEKSVAIKVAHDTPEAQAHVARLRDEARVLGLLNHRALVRVDGLFTFGGRWSVVMEYVDGVDMRAVHRALGKLPPRVALAIVGEAAEGLKAAWDTPGPDGRRLRLTHRDIKPSNLMLTAFGDVKVLDFGIARATFERREAVTVDLNFGSPAYLSPERADRLDHPNGDVFSLGVVLYELLTGERWGQTSASERRHEEQVDRVFVALREAGLPETVVAVVVLCLTYDPRGRPDIGALSDRCHQLADELSGPTLRRWAPEAVEAARALPNEPFDDRLISQTLLEDIQIDAPDQDDEPTGDPTADVEFVPKAPSLPPSQVQTLEPAPMPSVEPERKTPWLRWTLTALGAAAVLALPFLSRPSPPQKTFVPAPIEVGGDPVDVRGSNALTLKRGGTRIRLPATVPAGIWSVETTEGASLRAVDSVELRPGTVRLACTESECTVDIVE